MKLTTCDRCGNSVPEHYMCICEAVGGYSSRDEANARYHGGGDTATERYSGEMLYPEAKPTLTRMEKAERLFLRLCFAGILYFVYVGAVALIRENTQPSAQAREDAIIQQAIDRNVAQGAR